MIDHVIETLAIEGETEEEVRSILTTQAEQQVAIMESYRGQRDRDARTMMRQEMDDLRQATHEKLTSVLTEEQMATFNETMEAMRAQRRGQPGRQP